MSHIGAPICETPNYTLLRTDSFLINENLKEDAVSENPGSPANQERQPHIFIDNYISALNSPAMFKSKINKFKSDSLTRHRNTSYPRLNTTKYPKNSPLQKKTIFGHQKTELDEQKGKIGMEKTDFDEQKGMIGIGRTRIKARPGDLVNTPLRFYRTP
jgi:hypothetical protein